MDGELGLSNGSRVAVIGGGVAGAAMAAALLFTARARGRRVEVRVYEGPRDDTDPRPPVILSPDCRSRLAALGCRIPPEWRSVEVSAVELISGRNRCLLRGPPGGLWLVDGWPDGPSGRTHVSGSLASAAAMHGASFVSRRVERVEIAGRRLDERAPSSGAGSVVVWANGAGERFHAAALATPADAPVAERFFPGFAPAPTRPAAHARLRFSAPVGGAWPVAKLILAPLPGVDGLYLLPCRSTLYALAFGSRAAPADLCQALMMAARDGHLPEGFEIVHLGATRVPSGAGENLCAPGLLAVGPAAVGHPLQLGLSEALATCSRAAVALVDGAADRRTLHRRFARDGIYDLVEQSRAAVKSVQWLCRAGERAATAVEKAHRRSVGAPSWGSGVLALPTPSPVALAPRARAAAWAEAVSSLWRWAVEPVAASVPTLEPELYYVVDDDVAMRESISELLLSRGAEVVSFGDELALFSAASRRRPAAILLDVVLSWVDGLRLCEELKRHPLTRDTRVIVMSGLNRPHLRERALRAGAEAFVPKPLVPERLLRVLDPWTAHEPAWSHSSSRGAGGAR
jgi:CheY-like chemotaxis protein